MALKVYNKQYIKGIELLNRNWNIGDEIVYNSDPEDKGNEYLHLNYGTIKNIFLDNKNKQMIHINLQYGKIIIPLKNITLQFIPKHREHSNTNNHYTNTNNINLQEIERFFVYGILRDDNANMSNYTKNWLNNCKAESGRLYKFKLFKERYEDYPFAIKTNDKNDYINGRIISWHNNSIPLKRKLKIADRMEGYINDTIDNLYVRDIVDVLNENGDMIKAIAYYKNITKIEDLKLYDEIPFGDWLKRDKSRDLSEYNPSAQMLEMLKKMMENAKQNDELIDSLPLPPEDIEEKKSDTDISDDENEMDEKLNCYEYFRISGDNIAIMNNCKSVKKFRIGIHTAIGKYIIKSYKNNIYKWIFKINHKTNNNGVLAIGIIEKVVVCLNESFYQDEEFENYGYNVLNGYKITQNLFQQYAMQSKTDDIIEMELNMCKCNLGYYINGKYQGIAFDDIIKNNKMCYQMAVCLQQHHDEITLIDFKIIHQ